MKTFFSDRWALLVVMGMYGAIVLGMAFQLPGRDDVIATRYIATKTLKASHVITAGDLARPAHGPGRWGWFLPPAQHFIGAQVIEDVPAGTTLDYCNIRTPLPAAEDPEP